jgi:NDP-sugar pyrophosphorylase family protein
MKAMVLAAGEGTRLRPLTSAVPKALLPVAGVPLIERTLLWLKSHNVDEVAINLHYLGKQIEHFLGDGARFGIRIVYSPEEFLLGTAGGVKRLDYFFDSTFVVVYGDVVTDFNLSAMASFHRQKKAIATLAILKVPNPWEVGVVQIIEDGKLLSFVEKPPRGSEPGNLGSGGVYVLEKEALDYIPSNGFCDFAHDVFPKIINLGLPVYGYFLNHHDYLLDIGTLEKYQTANEELETRGVKI